jgi:hypothetical protein
MLDGERIGGIPSALTFSELKAELAFSAAELDPVVSESVGS